MSLYESKNHFLEFCRVPPTFSDKNDESRTHLDELLRTLIINKCKIKSKEFSYMHHFNEQIEMVDLHVLLKKGGGKSHLS